MNTNTINLSLYNTLRKALNLSEEETQNVAKAFQEVIAERVYEKEATVKELVGKELTGVVTKDFVGKEIAELSAKLEIKIAQSNANMIKWMFIFWAGQLAAMFGLLYFFLKK